eukprot:CAMPEP_0194265698 /NCGR_PEP_ID=MMETSP0169-20130528/850_1 /TAXON_ID=218684 /ORGANISM="Corethron pennatum, Strain L29A3" /LENGTH=229 /DNA_ID=CAMNT_0039006215 /DNA_START=34 /DNA_END=720 /DNA_ORIENTATION=+
MKKIIVSSPALCTIGLHAASAPYGTCRGILLARKSSSSSDDGTLEICTALPISNRMVPTGPLLDVAFSLAESACRRMGDGTEIAGWYVAPNYLEPSDAAEAEAPAPQESDDDVPPPERAFVPGILDERVLGSIVGRNGGGDAVLLMIRGRALGDVLSRASPDGASLLDAYVSASANGGGAKPANCEVSVLKGACKGMAEAYHDGFVAYDLESVLEVEGVDEEEEEGRCW